MVIFEGAEFEPLRVKKFKSDLTRVLFGFEVEFIQKMFHHFGLSAPPQPVEIELCCGISAFNRKAPSGFIITKAPVRLPRPFLTDFTSWPVKTIPAS